MLEVISFNKKKQKVKFHVSENDIHIDTTSKGVKQNGAGYWFFLTNNRTYYLLKCATFGAESLEYYWEVFPAQEFLGKFGHNRFVRQLKYKKK